MANQVIIVPVTSQKELLTIDGLTALFERLPSLDAEDCNKFEKDIKAIRQDLKIHKTYSHKIWILK